MNAEGVAYLDSSAIVKLVIAEPESAALRTHLRRRRHLVSSALARVEVLRAVLPHGSRTRRAAAAVLLSIDLVAISDPVLDAAGALPAAGLRSLDAIHLASAQRLASSLSEIVTYDRRMTAAAAALELPVVSPA